jgi:hypothetical protein
MPLFLLGAGLLVLVIASSGSSGSSGGTPAPAPKPSPSPTPSTPGQKPQNPSPSPFPSPSTAATDCTTLLSQIPPDVQTAIASFKQLALVTGQDPTSDIVSYLRTNGYGPLADCVQKQGI